MKFVICTFILLLGLTQAFTTTIQQARVYRVQTAIQLNASSAPTDMATRRNFVENAQTGFLSIIVGNLAWAPLAGAAEEEKIARKPLESSLYTILRVREATEQETRLIKSGKFKDVQRANVKLACRFMLQNYRLADNFNSASTYLNGNKRYEATDAGQAVVQALYTILEYFDSSDVENLKVGMTNNMAGKEYIVINGLDAARNGIDRFLAYFPQQEVDAVKELILEENRLNEKEFDPSLGTILNLKPST